VKNKGKKKIHKDKHGREFIKESFFIGGKMKFHRIYVIDGIPAQEFYEKNATAMDFYINEDYHLIKSEKDFNTHSNIKTNNELNIATES
jgi:hypothetical protein